MPPQRLHAAWQRLAAALLALLLAPLAQALDVPPLAGRVNDYAGIMRAETVQALTEKLAAQEAENSVQIVVLTIPSLQGENLEEFALKTASTWQIGQKGKDNGALLLVAVKEREIRIETGYGLEDRLTDLATGRIIRSEIIPQFRSGDYDGGIAKGVEAMMAAARGQYAAPQPGAEGAEGPDVDDETLEESVGVLGFLTLMAGLLARRKFWHTLLAGAAAGTLAWLIYADTGLAPWGFLFLGVLGALCIAWIVGHFTGMGSGGSGGGFSSGGGSFGGGGGGGFSGGGGSFGGGGAGRGF
ncbi:MAG: TPM domain-containing protein [Ottowia sp.]|nr:TPM domain-containing protein [Ottowia sp.]